MFLAEYHTVIPVLKVHKSKEIVANIAYKPLAVAVQYKTKLKRFKKKQMDTWAFVLNIITSDVNI